MTKPAAISLVLCDTIYRESSGKTALVGLFNTITGHRFPLRQARMSVYASVTEADPTARFRLEIVNGETDQPVVRLEGPPPDKTTPLTVCDFNFELRNIVFPEPGMYFARFWAGDSLLLQRPFSVVQAASASGDMQSGGRI